MTSPYDYPRPTLDSPRSPNPVTLAVTDAGHVHVEAKPYTPKGYRKPFNVSLHLFVQPDGTWDAIDTNSEGYAKRHGADYMRIQNTYASAVNYPDAVPATDAKLKACAELAELVTLYMASEEAAPVLLEAAAKANERALISVDNNLADARARVATLEAQREAIVAGELVQ